MVPAMVCTNLQHNPVSDSHRARDRDRQEGSESPIMGNCEVCGDASIDASDAVLDRIKQGVKQGESRCVRRERPVTHMTTEDITCELAHARAALSRAPLTSARARNHRARSFPPLGGARVTFSEFLLELATNWLGMWYNGIMKILYFETWWTIAKTHS